MQDRFKFPSLYIGQKLHMELTIEEKKSVHYLHVLPKGFNYVGMCRMVCAVLHFLYLSDISFIHELFVA